MKTKIPLVYIILVNYYGTDDTSQCINSIKQIKYPNYKIIIVNNSPADDSINGLKAKYTDIILINSEKNLGFAAGNNIGIRYALRNKAEYILLLNNDTIADKDFLSHLVETAENDAGAGIIGGKIFYYNDPGKLWFAGGIINPITGRTKHIGKNEVDNGRYESVREVDFITGCMMLVKKEAIEKAGLMDERYFLYYEDVDWNVRLKKAGYRILFNPDSVIYHKESSSTRKLSNVKMYYYDRNIWYFAKMNLNHMYIITTFIYVCLFLFFKALKSLILINKNKLFMIGVTYKSIFLGEMGEYKP